MNIKSYLNLVALLKIDSSTGEENRAFSLTHPLLKNQPLAQLSAWVDIHKNKLKRPLLSETFSTYLYSTTLILVLLAFFLGFFSGLGLLSYSGAEPVNVIYFMVMVIVLPLATMFITFISMLRVNASQSILVHLSPAFWVEKILALLPGRIQENMKAFKLNPLLSNWLVIQRSQVISLFFSLGLLFALFAIVVTKDIAFAWSTTLHITPEEFHVFLRHIAFAWEKVFPWAVPNMTLIEESHYFRLGDTVSTRMLSQAPELGEWWKFLAFSTLFYAIFLRIVMLLLTTFGFKRALKQSFLNLNAAKRLLSEMNEPLISTHAKPMHDTHALDQHGYENIIHTLDASYDSIQGWAIRKDVILVLGDSIGVLAPSHCKVGGTNSIEEDDEVIFKSKGEVLLLGKSWEHPSSEFLDYVIDLSKKVDKIIIMPIGVSTNPYDIKAEDIEGWSKKLSAIKNEKVWLKR